MPASEQPSLELGGHAATSGRRSRSAAGTKRKAAKPRPEPAEENPVARIAVDVSLPHLDRPFDYLVPAGLDATALPGCRVRVRFAGRLTDGYVLERCPASEHAGQLLFIDRLVSPEPVLRPEIVRLARAVADRYAGSLADVLRLAVPPRHARVEAETPPQLGPPPAATEPAEWSRYTTGAAFIRALADGHAPRAVWTALPGCAHWPRAIAEAVRATLAGGRGALVVLPDGRDVARVDAALDPERRGDAGTEGRIHVVLTAGLGPAERYRRWLAASRGAVRAVVGTRAAMFAPVEDLGLVVLWDDGDDSHAEPHAPYPHAREVLALRAHQQRAAALIGGFARTTETTRLVVRGWARPLTASREVVRAHAPRVRVAGDDAELARDEAARSARLPSLALRVARDGLRRGPVLVQVPRRGYLPALSCARCRTRVRCSACSGPLALRAARTAPSCAWCGRPAADRRCESCGGHELRGAAVGAHRTAEELGRAFPAVTVRTSGRGAVLDEVGDAAALVVATPGAEPVAHGGYAAALLLDGWAMLGRAELRAAEEALRRWMGAAALVRPATAGGSVVVMAQPGLPPVQALVRWEPVTYAERELDERETLGFPPAVRMAAVSGPGPAVRDLLSHARFPEAAEVLGPVAEPAADGDEQRVLIRVRREHGAALSRALKDAARLRSARKADGVARIRLDDPDTI